MHINHVAVHLSNLFDNDLSPKFKMFSAFYMQLFFTSIINDQVIQIKQQSLWEHNNNNGTQENAQKYIS